MFAPVQMRGYVARMRTQGEKMITSLSDYLADISKIVTEWRLEKPGGPYYESQHLWFRGHHESSWKLTPKLYRREYKYADENEIRYEFESRALQLIQGRVPNGKWE